jgi:hypothetical protein
MKTLNILCFVFAASLFIPLMAYTQAISSVNTIPSAPSSTDTVKVLANVWLPSSGCWVESKSGSVAGNNVSIAATFNSGMLTTICNMTDTFNLGTLPSGTYHGWYKMYYVGLPLFVDSTDFTFTVGGTTDIQTNLQYNRAFSVCLKGNLAKVQVNYSLLQQEVPLSLKVYSEDGRLVQSLPLEKSNSTVLYYPAPSHSGLYLYSLSTSLNRNFSCKLFIP